MADTMIEEQIEPAEEAGDKGKLLEILKNCTEKEGDDDWAEATEAALDAYYRLTKGSPESSDGLGVIFSCLGAWKEEEAIVEVALGCVVTLAYKKETTSNKDDDLQVDLIVTLMKAFPDEGTIQEQACLAVEGLASSSSAWKDKLLAAGVEAELLAAVDRITNERNKSYPGKAASALGITFPSV